MDIVIVTTIVIFQWMIIAGKISISPIPTSGHPSKYLSNEQQPQPSQEFLWLQCGYLAESSVDLKSMDTSDL